MTNEDMREHPRTLPKNDVTINDGTPYQGGKLQDMSCGGALVSYPLEVTPTSEPIEVGQVLDLRLHGLVKTHATVTRTFEGGFATKFDSSIPVVF